MNTTENRFQQFLSEFEPRVISASVLATRATWDAAVSATDENAEKSGELEAKRSILFSDRKMYDELLEFKRSGEVQDPVQKRILDLLILSFKGNMLPEEMLREISGKEAEIRKIFDQFRPELWGKKVTDNDILEILKHEANVSRRKEAWDASKQVGTTIAPFLRELVALRNRAAGMLGFKNYFEMAYELQELDAQEVTGTFTELGKRSANVYDALLAKIKGALSERFGVAEEEVGPWTWSNPFGQENPLTIDLNPDALFESADIVERTAAFYKSIGIDLDDVFRRSDLFERENKNPHASCWDMDREGDVRILANIRPNFQWYRTMMHEAGHAAYDVGIIRNLPWFLRDPAHILTTEASAIFFEQTGEHYKTIQALFGFGREREDLLQKIEASFKEQRLIFSRWATVVTLFEKGMYENPEQNLQELWWDLIEGYQKIKRPAGRGHFADYAAKIHISSSPCYYQNYLLADILVSELQNTLTNETGTDEVFGNEKAGRILKERFYGPGSLYHWKELVVLACKKSFGIDDWVYDVL